MKLHIIPLDRPHHGVDHVPGGGVPAEIGRVKDGSAVTFSIAGISRSAAGFCPRYSSIMVDYQSVPTASRIFRLSLKPRGVQTSFSTGPCRTETSNVHRFTLISATQISACEGSRGLRHR